MYRPGHYGAALLAYAPVGAVLLVVDRPGLAVVGAAVVLALAPVPDYDHRVPFVTHRGATHTVGFALLVAAAVGVAGWTVAGDVSAGGRTTLAALGFVVGLVAIGSHLLADVITPAGVAVLWPVSGRTYSLNLVRADNRLANWGLLVAGVFVSVTVALTLAPV